MPSSVDALAILLLLVPGLVGLMVFSSLAVDGQRDSLDKVVWALVLTTLAQMVTHTAFGLLAAKEGASPADLMASQRSSVVWLNTCVASLLGGAAAYFANKQIMHRLARRMGLTPRTGHLDVWHEVVTSEDAEGCWVHVRFMDGKRIIGWPKSFSLAGDRPGLFLANATWYLPTDDGDDDDEVEVVGPGVMITNFDVVMAVEFLY